jgi:hypothetical protein
MNRAALSFSTMLFALMASLFTCTDVIAQLPGRDSRPGPKEKIRDVLEGAQPAPTGDGVLEDILGVIQNQGSILDGSMLDENAIQPMSSHRSRSITRRAQVAEQLLRAARMLEAITSDESSANLVQSMRQQAAKLLVENEPPDSTKRPTQ